MDLGKSKEAVAVAAIVDKSCLQRRFDARDLCKIDISAQLLLVLRFEVEFLYAVSTNDNDAGLLGMGGVDKHFFCH
jgi:hypothetical protein